jgi:hypothetical protein
LHSYGGQGPTANRIEPGIRRAIDTAVAENKRRWEAYIKLTGQTPQHSGAPPPDFVPPPSFESLRRGDAAGPMPARGGVPHGYGMREAHPGAAPGTIAALVSAMQSVQETAAAAAAAAAAAGVGMGASYLASGPPPPPQMPQPTYASPGSGFVPYGHRGSAPVSEPRVLLWILVRACHS